MLDINLFKSVVVRQGYTQDSLAAKIGISANTMSNKITGKTSFTTTEIDRICDVLNITDNAEKANIFLANSAQIWGKVSNK